MIGVLDNRVMGKDSGFVEGKGKFQDHPLVIEEGERFPQFVAFHQIVDKSDGVVDVSFPASTHILWAILRIARLLESEV